MNLRDYISIVDLERDRILNYREQLYARGRNLLLKFNHIIELIREQHNLSLNQLAKDFGVSVKQLRKWRYGETPIPLRILKMLTEGNSLQMDIENEIEYISSSRGKKVKIPRKISPLLIEILGRFSGDGSCGIYNGDYKWSLKEEGKRFVRANLRDMETIFGIGGIYIDYDTYAENLIRSKPLVLLFQQIFDYTEGFEKTYHIEPPYFLDYIDWDNRKLFTTGLIDTEGSFYYTNQSYYFEIHMVNEYLVNEVALAFDEFDIPYNYKQRSNNRFKLISYGKVNCSLILDTFEIKNEKHLIKLADWGLL